MSRTASRHAREQRSRRKRWRRGCLAAVLIIAAIICIAIGVMIWLANSEPANWQQQQSQLAQINPAQRTAQADNIQNRVTSQLFSDYHEPDPIQSQTNNPQPLQRTIRLTIKECNIWLNTRLDDWLANQEIAMPPFLDQVLFAADQGQPVLMFRLTTPQFSQIISLKFDLQKLDNGNMQVNVNSAYTGKMPIPIKTLIEQVGETVGDSDTGNGLEKLREFVAGINFDPMVKTVKPYKRLIDWTLTDEVIELTFEQLPAK